MAVHTMAKMATLVLFFCALLCLVPTGAIAKVDSEPCQDSDVQISTAPTGKIIGGQKEYVVTVSNKCSCPLAGIVFSCPDGLQSTEPVDWNKIHIVDNQGMLCLVNNGWPINKGSQVTFTYAWKATLSFVTYNATPRC